MQYPTRESVAYDLSRFDSLCAVRSKKLNSRMYAARRASMSCRC